MERSFIIIKPDAVQRGLIGEIIRRFEQKGLKLVGLKMLQVTREQAGRQYSCHLGRPFYDSLVQFMTSGPVCAMTVEGKNAINLVRKMVGATAPENAEPGTIRGDFAINVQNNLVHASDSAESVAHELPIYFSEQDLMKYDSALKDWFCKG
ncbi:MAG: nucleoside-diphosphate kinase [Candidatus Riflebacteria bacterium]|nr:nucleoside-diphosphate kinase [Candidatus Riflebacteria bacterium]